MSKRRSKIAKYGGKLKERRNDCPLITLPLTIDEEGLGRPKTSKKYDKIIERIGRLKERYGVGNLYTIVHTTSDLYSLETFRRYKSIGNKVVLIIFKAFYTSSKRCSLIENLMEGSIKI